MDEILIDEKRYVSSKQAAKLTGYAKDYIGQLCREGRVPARLVGRSWYVLESAIKDHRFGANGESEPAEKTMKAGLPSTWEAPKYEIDPVFEAVPHINRIKAHAEASFEALETPVAPAEEDQVQDTWRAWFDRIVDTTGAVTQSVQSEPESRAEDVEIAGQVHATIQNPGEMDIRRVTYDPPPAELLPMHDFSSNMLERPSDEHAEAIEPQMKQKRSIGNRKIVPTIATICIFSALIAAGIALLNSGALDKYVGTIIQVEPISGLYIVNK